MAVMIDIPGIGSIEAKNAASEQTLKEILKALQGVQKNTGPTPGKGKGGGGDNGGGGGDSGGSSSTGGGIIGKTFRFLNKSAGQAAGMMAKTAVGGAIVAKKFVDVSVASTQMVQEFSNIGDSLGNAASALRNIPVVGGVLSTVFGAVAQAVENTTGAYQAAAGAGASFGGSIGEFSRAATEAGMTMADFGSLIRSNGEGMLGFAGTTEEGAKRFGQVSKALRTTSSDLYALGFSTKDINEGLANYGRNLRMQGLQGKKSNEELAAGAKNYLKEIDALAKITGEDRKAKEAERERLLKDAQFQASMAGLNDKVRDSFLNTVQQLPDGVQNFAKDIMAAGTATTAENQLLMSQMPESAKMLTSFHQKMQRGEAVTLEERARLNDLMAREGPAALKSIKYAGSASQELTGLVNGLASTQKMQVGAVKEATAEQIKAAEETDKQNKALEEAKQKLAAFSNTFSMFLAQSGLLDGLMKVFSGLATVVQTVVVPIFQFFAKGLQSAVDVVSNIFGAEDSGLAETVEEVMSIAKNLLSTVGGLFESVLTSIDWKGIFGNIVGVGKNIFGALNSILIDLSPVFSRIYEVGQDLFHRLVPVVNDIVEIVKVVSGVLAPLLAPLVDAVGSILGGFFSMVGGFVRIVKGILTGDLTAIWEGFEDIVGGFFERLGGLLDLMWQMLTGPFKAVWNLITGKGNATDEEKKAEIAKAEADRLAEKKEAAMKKAADGDKTELERLQRIEKQKEELKKQKEKEKNAEEKRAAEASKAAKTAEATAKASMDYNASSEGILKAFVAQEGSPLIPKAETAAKAETAKKEIEQKSEEKAAAEKRAEKEAEAKKAAEDKVKEESTKKPATTQESAETLLAQLNTNMAELIKLTKEQKDIGAQQLTVQRSLTGDLFASVG